MDIYTDIHTYVCICMYVCMYIYICIYIAAKQMPPFSPALQVLKRALQLLINRYG